MNKVADQHSNTYNHSIDKKPINVDYSALTEKIETSSFIRKLLNLKWMIESELLTIRKFSVKVTLKIAQKYLLLILFCKLTLGLIKLKI